MPATEAEVVALRAVLEKLHQDVTSLQADNNELRNSVASLKKCNSSQALTSLQSDNIKLKNDVDKNSLIQDLSKLQTEFDSLRNEGIALKRENSILKQDVDSMKKELGQLKEVLTYQVDRNSDASNLPFNEEVPLLQAAIAKLSHDVTDIQEQNAELRRDKYFVTSETANLKAETSRLQTRVSQLSEDLNAVQREAAALLLQITTSQSTTARLKGDVAVLQGDTARLFRNLSASVDQCRGVEQEVKSLQDQVQTCSKEITSLKTVKGQKDKPAVQKPCMDQTVYHSRICRESQVSHETGILSYKGGRITTPASQFVGQRPLTPECNKFSIVIIDQGRSREIAIGLCPQSLPVNNLPGWTPQTVGYHADNGGIYLGAVTAHTQSQNNQCWKGDVMAVEFDFTMQCAKFYKNSLTIFMTDRLEIPEDGFYPVVGMHSPGEAVRLLQKEPWKPAVV